MQKARVFVKATKKWLTMTKTLAYYVSEYIKLEFEWRPQFIILIVGSLGAWPLGYLPLFQKIGFNLLLTNLTSPNILPTYLTWLDQILYNPQIISYNYTKHIFPESPILNAENLRPYY